MCEDYQPEMSNGKMSMDLACDQSKNGFRNFLWPCTWLAYDYVACSCNCGKQYDVAKPARQAARWRNRSGSIQDTMQWNPGNEGICLYWSSSQFWATLTRLQQIRFTDQIASVDQCRSRRRSWPTHQYSRLSELSRGNKASSMAQEDVIRIGILGAANIARKNVAAILKADNVGECLVLLYSCVSADGPPNLRNSGLATVSSCCGLRKCKSILELTYLCLRSSQQLRHL